MKLLRLFLWFLLFVFGSCLAYVTFVDIKDKPNKIGGEFKAISTKNFNGGKISQNDMLGKPHVMFFGYTHCPDFCPASLSFMSGWLDELGEQANELDIYFITVDPKRDTIEHLKNYLTHFHKGIIGISGTKAEIENITKKWRVVAIEEEGGLFTHTTTIFLMDRQGEFVGTIGYGENEKTAIMKLRNLL